MPEAKWVAGTLVVPTSTSGNHVSRVDVVISGTAKQITCTRVEINDKLDEDQPVRQVVNSYNDRQRVALRQPTSNPAPIDPTQPFYSYQTCISCHRAEYDQWRLTKHAIALQTLDKQNKLIGDCLPCHSEMYVRTKSIVISSNEVGGVECMSCHENVLPHGADFRKKGEVQPIRDVCAHCHTKERSPSFDLTTWYGRVKHTSK
jgi:hypothetical protein